MPDLREQNARDNYRQLKQDIRALVNKDSTATTSSSTPPTSPPPNVSTANIQSQPPGQGQAPQGINKKVVSFNEGQTLAKDDSGKLVVGRKDTKGKGDGEKEYLLSVNKTGFSEDSASSLLDHSNNSTTGLLKGQSSPESLPREKYDRLNDWHVDNPSDIWVSYEPPESEESRRRVEERIPLGYSPGRPHKTYPGSSLPNSPSPSSGRREFPVTVSQPTSPQKPAMIRTYMVPLRPDGTQYEARDRPKSYAPPPTHQIFVPVSDQSGQQGSPQYVPQAFIQPRKSWSPGQSPEAYFPPGQFPPATQQLPHSPKSRKNSAFPAFPPPSPNARRLAMGGPVLLPAQTRGHQPVSQGAALSVDPQGYHPQGHHPHGPVQSRGHMPISQGSSLSPDPQEYASQGHHPRGRSPVQARGQPVGQASPQPSDPHGHQPHTPVQSSGHQAVSQASPLSPETHQSRRRSPSPRSPRKHSRGRSPSPGQVIDGRHVTVDIADTVRNMTKPDSHEDLMQVTCL